MEFPFYTSKVLPTDEDGFVILDAANCNKRSNYLNSTSKGYSQPLAKYPVQEDQKYLAQIIDKMGEASCIAQGLRQVITTYNKFISSGDNRLYIKVDDNKVCGMIKVGQRNLFYYDGFGKVKELSPLCVLDFYVHESMQRVGIGKMLFEKMLQCEGAKPHKLAYDRPSIKLISFLKKHYGLVKYIPQNNNFVIFDQYWEDPSRISQPKTHERGFLPNLDVRDRRSLGAKVSQTEFHKVGKSILDNQTGPVFAENDPLRLAQNLQVQPRMIQNSKLNENFNASGSIRKPEELNNPGSRFERAYNPTYELENKIKATDNAFSHINERQRMASHEKPLQMNTGYGYPTTYGGYRAPWAGHGVTHDSFKSSLAYGSHYTQANFNTWNRK